MINIEDFRELIESMDIIAENKLKMASQFYYCLVKSVSNNKCTIVFNNKEYIVPFYGGSPKANKTYAVFLPQNNMNQAFVIGEGASGSGGSGIAVQSDEPINGELVWIDTDDSVFQFRETKNDPWQKLSADFGSSVPVSMGGTGADNVADARTNLGLETIDLSSSVSSIYSGYSVKLLKCGDIVSISIRTSSASVSGSNSWITLCNIPESVRPSNPIDTMGVNNIASNTQALPLQFRVNANGNVAVYLYSGTTTRPMGEITFNLKT